MAIINKDVFLGITDRIAKQYVELKSGIEGGIGGTSYYDRITETNDYDVETALMTTAHDADAKYTIDSILVEIPTFSNLISKLESHLKSAGGYRNIQEYLSGVSIQVSDEFAEVYNILTGREIEEDFIDDDRPISL